MEREMSSLLAKPPSTLLRLTPPLILSIRSRISYFSLSFPKRPTTGRRLCLKLRCNGADGKGSDENSAPGEPGLPNGAMPKSRKDVLLEHVRNVQPEFMELFIKRAPQQVVDAMRQTVTNMIGTLPPQFFAVTVATVAENLAQLMYSVLMTGYMFRNAQFRMELQQSLEQVSLPDAQGQKDTPDFAPGAQKKVSGEVIRWNNVSGIEIMGAVKYIELLEAEIEELNRQVARKSANGQNELLDYLKSLGPQNLKDFTSNAGEDVIMAVAVASAQVFAVKMCSFSRSDKAQVDLNSLPISRRLAVAVASSSSLSLISLPPLAVARERRNRKVIPLEDYHTSPDGLKYYDVVEGKGPVADEGTTVEVHFDCVYRGITAVSSRESKLLAGNRIIAQRYAFKVGSSPGKERKRDYVDNPNGLFSAQAAPKPPPAMYKMTRGMRVGGKRTVVVPPEAGYGDKGMNEIPPGATFDLNIELLKVIAANEK